jgi:glycosyltransferase involved in cell wall biosynthesis
MIESLACGTPVIAFNHGSVPEILEHGKTAFIVESVEEAVDAVKRLDLLDRGVCRQQFELKFSVEAMVDGYEVAYEKVVAEKRLRQSPRSPIAPADWSAA